MPLRKPKSRYSKALIISFASILVTITVVMVFVILYAEGAFKQKPKITVKPKNTYETTLRVATDHDYKPFSYIEDNEYKGLDVELIYEVANRLEMNVELTLRDWEECQAGLKDGTYDIILNMESNAILKDDELIGTIPTDEKQYVVYGKHRVNYVGELYGMRVAAYNKFDELGMDIITGYSYQEMFEMLLADQLDYIICPIQVGNSFVEKLHAERKIVSSYQVSYMYGCMALKNSDTVLCAALNDVIKDLQIEGFIEKLDAKWVVNRYGSVSFSEVIRNYPVIIVLIGLAILFALLFTVYIVLAGFNNKKQRAFARELQKNNDIINQQNLELKEANEKANAASKAKTDFLFNMSHDIRTPMNAIIGFTDLARRHLNDEKLLNDYLLKISSSSELLLGLINNVLEMARIESGKVQLNLEPHDLIEIWQQIDDLVRAQADKKHHTLVFENDVNNRYVLCDKLKINQVLMNLVSNAVKYTNDGGNILVSLKQLENDDPEYGKYQIIVKDNGLGMSKEFQEKIFDEFERENTTTVSKITGTGLGTTITKNLVDLMGGTISVESELGKGSTFTVIIDLKTCEEKDVVKEEVIVSNNVKEDKTKYHILVVDDNEINRIIACELLKDMGYEATEADSGDAALEFIKAAKPGDFDLILMDVQMPGMNGYEATDAIRKLNSPLSSLPIIALTANAFEDDKKNALKAGMNGHISKPIDICELNSVLEKFLAK